MTAPTAPELRRLAEVFDKEAEQGRASLTAIELIDHDLILASVYRVTHPEAPEGPAASRLAQLAASLMDEREGLAEMVASLMDERDRLAAMVPRWVVPNSEDWEQLTESGWLMVVPPHHGPRRDPPTALLCPPIPPPATSTNEPAAKEGA